MADFEQKSQVLAGGTPLTKAQAWSTWFWLLLHKTFHAARRPAATRAGGGGLPLAPWLPQWGIQFQRHTVVKHGC